MSWLTGYELENLINKNAGERTRKAFLGVFAMDALPEQIPHLPVLLIINTHTSNLSGEHWKAVYISEERYGEVFDSLGQPASTRLVQWMNRFTRKWMQSPLIFQNPRSATCGGFVLYYIFSRLRAPNLRACIGAFTNNPFDNDRLVIAFVKSLKK